MSGHFHGRQGRLSDVLHISFICMRQPRVISHALRELIIFLSYV
ncbi:hypothetical protein B4135_3546 [Caldibacillus debilis]|uniref:Uncharacterized protein n=1 Tax=Caldibacillus debilis TaxID=301148 RepID=A0A150LDF8_9BACI|nr:hypothetical protein B4135_3546 [Caldibacillus debilis]